MDAVTEWNGHRGPCLDTANGFEVIACERCAFKHVVPIPTVEQLESIYRHDYYTREKPLYLERVQEDLPWWEINFGDRYATLEGLLPPGRRSLLEIGSGPGYFLRHGARRGWRVRGVEPSDKARDHSRSLGLDVIDGFFDGALAETLEPVDAVHMATVLEHVPDPETLLRHVGKVLSPGGVLCVGVPNDYSPFQHAARTAEGLRPWWVAPPHHINYFDFDSLAGLLSRVGFDVAVRDTTFPIDLFLLMGDHYIDDDALGRACHGRRKRLEATLAAAGLDDLRRAWYRATAQLGIGREVVLYAVRRDDD